MDKELFGYLVLGVALIIFIIGINDDINTPKGREF